MRIALVFGFLLIIAMFLAWRSLRDLEVPAEVVEAVRRIDRERKRLWGIILFLGDKVIHYSSDTSSSKPDD